MFWFLFVELRTSLWDSHIFRSVMRQQVCPNLGGVSNHDVEIHAKAYAPCATKVAKTRFSASTKETHCLYGSWSEFPMGIDDRARVHGSFPKNVLGLTKYRPSEESLSRCKGVYTIFDHEGVTQYVGSSNDIHKRLLDHLRSGVLQKGAMAEAVIFSKDTSQQEIFDYERRRIKELNPPKNKHLGTPGRIWNSEHIVKLKKFYIFNKEEMRRDSREILRRFLDGDKMLSRECKVVRAFLRMIRYF